MARTGATGDDEERRQDQGPPALPHLSDDDEDDDLPHALPRGCSTHRQARRGGRRNAPEAGAGALARDDPEAADTGLAERLRRACRLSDGQRAVLLP